MTGVQTCALPILNKKVFSAAILASAAMAMTSCSTSKNAQNENVTKAEKITEAEAARPSADEEMDESYLVLSEAQQNIVKKNNDFAFRLYQQISGMDSDLLIESESRSAAWILRWFRQ